MNERRLAKQYIDKIDSSEKRDISFELTFSQFKKLLSLKRCYYTSRPFIPYEERNESNRGSWRTLDRIDNSKGYTLENTVACCGAINFLKSVIENPQNDLTFKQAINALSKVEL